MVAATAIEKKKNYIVSCLKGDDSQCECLEAMGITPGCMMSLVSKMPFKGPVSLKIRGTKFALRRQDADCIQVTPA